MLLPLFLLTACGPKLTPHALDQAVLADSPELAHLAAAGTPASTVADLLALDDPGFTAAPHPGEWLAGYARDRRVQGEAGPGEVDLRVLTFNTALLDRLSMVGRYAMPHTATRAEQLPGRLLAEGWDVLILQEVWDWDQVEAFRAAARVNGYQSYAGTKRHHERHGLMILVKDDVIGTSLATSEALFDSQRKAERFPGPGIARGYIHWRFELAATGQAVDVFDTHVQAFPSFWDVRARQVRQLGLAADAVPDDHLVIVGGDLNAGYYYPSDTFGIYKGKPVTGWWLNSLSTPLLLHYGGLWDVHTAAGTPRDVQRIDGLVYDSSWLTVPMGGVCDKVPHDTFTGSDCNTNYFASYGGEEYPARLDYLMVGGADGRVGVVSAELTHTAVQDWGDGSYEPSDHYGVGAVLRVGTPSP